MRNRTILLTLVGSLVVTACGAGDSSATTQPDVAAAASSTTATSPTTTTSAPTTTTMWPTTATQPTPTAFHPVPADHVGVTGTARCSFPGGEELTVVCEVVMSDPRVSGTEVSSNYQNFGEEDDEDEDEDVSAAAGVWVADAVLTNDEGTWRGVTQAADDTTPCGESHYVGEGAYEGLEFHYYFCHADLGDEAELRGWIYSTESPL